SSAEPQLDWYADETEASPTPPAGQGAKGQACAGSITLDKYTVNDGGTVTVEVRIPALWRDEIDFVQIKGNASGTAVGMGNGLYVWHDVAPTRYMKTADNVKVTFLAMKGNETVCTGTTSYAVAVTKFLSVAISKSAQTVRRASRVMVRPS
ncbi:MAG TPA: hypothetical protein VN260_07260, partial [Dissulfurispiraceae bacterium]|nr:hypothetical protein [Dissulfurispiraceae bacterium]